MLKMHPVLEKSQKSINAGWFYCVLFEAFLENVESKEFNSEVKMFMQLVH